MTKPTTEVLMYDTAVSTLKLNDKVVNVPGTDQYALPLRTQLAFMLKEVLDDKYGEDVMQAVRRDQRGKVTPAVDVLGLV